jgi:hypothetical protein
MISTVYNNKNNIPVNRQATHEFFLDHESIAPDFSGNRSNFNVGIKYFKKATEKLRESGDPLPITLIDYERVCSSIKRTKKENLPSKYEKLIRHIMHMTKCNKKLSIAVVKKMRDERFINVVGDYVEYF